MGLNIALLPGHHPTNEWPGIHFSYMHKIIARIHKTRSVNALVNGLSHMPRSNMETLYKYSKRKELKTRLSATEMAF